MSVIDGTGNLIKVVSDAPIFAGQLSERSKQLVIDRQNRDNRADACAPDGAADKLGLTDAVWHKVAAKSAYSSSVMRGLTTRLRWGVSYFLRGMGFTSFHFF